MRVDAGRLASLASRPGIDPRVWLSLAHVKEVGFDPKEGCFADIVLQPSGEEDTAYYGQPYAGGGFGDHCPLEVDDTVLVAIPMGDSGNGPVIVARFNNAGDPPHADFGEGAEPSGHRQTRVKQDRKLMLRASGSGLISVVQEGSGNVEVTCPAGFVDIGNEPGQPAADVPPYDSSVQRELKQIKQELDTLKTLLAAHIHTSAAPGSPTTPPVPPGDFSAWVIQDPQPTAAKKVRIT